MSNNSISFNYGGQVISLVKSPHLAALQLASPQTRRPKTRSATTKEVKIPETEMQLGPFQIVALPQTHTKERSIGDSTDTDALDALRAQDDVIVGSHVFHLDGSSDTQTPIVPSGKVYIEFMSDTGKDEQREILAEYYLSVEKVMDDNENAVVAAVSTNSPNPIKITTALQQSEKVLVAEPELIMPASTNALPTNKLLKEEWHLENTGKATLAYGQNHFKEGADAKVIAAWKVMGNLGSPDVCIAVVDTGFDLAHPDLKGNGNKIKAPIDLETSTTDVYPNSGSNHGTACAGVALGSASASGIAGACPNATFIPIKMPYLSDDIIERMATHILQNEADIVSCSLGFPNPTPLSTRQQNALQKLVREGRNGKGCSLFFATGNSTRPLSDFADCRDVFAITASNSLDEFSTYSNYGENVFICAPSNGESGAGITTCDLTGDAGDAPRNYLPSFGGTSSATPLVAGICGLLLSINPNLRVEDIRNLLKDTAEKIDVTGGYPDPEYHSIYTGYGKVNALRAVNRLLNGSGLPNAGTNNPADPSEIPNTGDKNALVTAFQLNVRSGPSTNHPIVGQIMQGESVVIEAFVGVWCKIGDNRYVNGKYLKVLREAKQGMVTARRLNVRADSNMQASVLRTLTARTVVDILETNNGWYRIGDFEWVSAKFIRVLN